MLLQGTHESTKALTGQRLATAAAREGSPLAMID